ncbi:MAG: hypothetical protein MZV64_71300 [Ignavibacteriales bacterium]|nr:hypothetical protein [Ignavibacteriales bacterium]
MFFAPHEHARLGLLRVSHVEDEFVIRPRLGDLFELFCPDLSRPRLGNCMRLSSSARSPEATACLPAGYHSGNPPCRTVMFVNPPQMLIASKYMDRRLSVVRIEDDGRRSCPRGKRS